jgi:hypothetical protein
LDANWHNGLRELRLVCFPAVGRGEPMMVWSLAQGEKVSRQIMAAAERFALAMGMDPQFAFVRSIPTGAEEFVDVRGVTLVRADWVPEGFICLGRGGLSRKVDDE